MDDRVADPPLPPRAALRWSIVRQIIAEQQPETILELGCGLGSVGARLARTGDLHRRRAGPAQLPRRAAADNPARRDGVQRRPPAGPDARDGTTWSARSRCWNTSPTTRRPWPSGCHWSGRVGACCSPCRPIRTGSAPGTSWSGHYRRYSAGQLGSDCRGRCDADQNRPLRMATRLSARRGTEPLGGLAPPGFGWRGRDGTAQERTTRSGRVLQPRGRSSAGTSGWRCRRSPRSSGCDRTAVRDSSRWPPAPGDTWSASAGRTPVFPVAVRPGWSAGEPGGGAGGTRRPDRRSRRRRRACRRRALSHGARSVTVRAQSRCAADRRAATGTRA